MSIRIGKSLAVSTTILLILAVVLNVSEADISLSSITDSVFRSLTKCDERNETLTICLKKRSLLLLNKYTRAADHISLISNSLVLVNNEKDTMEGSPRSLESNLDMQKTSEPGLSLEKLEANLPSEEAPKQEMLDSLLINSISKFLQTRSLQIKLPQFLTQFIRSGLFEGRGKKDKYNGAIMLGAMLVAGTLIPIKLGTLALISGKALMTSMLALMLSAIVALKKLSSDSKSQGTTTYEVINVPAGHPSHGHHARSLPLPISSLPPFVNDHTMLPKTESNYQESHPYTLYKPHYNHANDSNNASSDSEYIL